MFRPLSLLIVASSFLVACGRADLPAPPSQISTQLKASQAPTEVGVEEKLFSLWEEEIRGNDPAYVDALNERVLQGLENKAPVAGAKEFSPEAAAEAYRALDTNVVTNNRTDYEQPGTAIGYCFGRAMFVHLYALRNHYRKGQIRKLWAVGTMKTSAYNWAFHVATVVQDGATGEWRVIDSFMNAPVSPRKWFTVFQAQNKADHDLRLYVSSAEKFTPDLGKYSRAQLGLDLPAHEDWYRHYFVDMMETLKIRRELNPPRRGRWW